MESGGVVDAFVPAAVQVGPVPVDGTHALARTVDELVGGGREPELADGLVSQAEDLTDLGVRPAFRQEGVDDGMVFSGAERRPGFRHVRGCVGRWFLIGGWRLGWELGQVGAMGTDRGFDRSAQVVPQMPPVSDFDRLRRALAGAFGVTAGPVAADHLHAGMLTQPGGEDLAGAAVQDIDGPVGGRVDEDRGVGLAAPFGEVVHAQDRDRADLGVGQCPDQPDQQGAGHEDAQVSGQARPSAPGQGQRDVLQQPTQ